MLIASTLSSIAATHRASTPALFSLSLYAFLRVMASPRLNADLSSGAFCSFSISAYTGTQLG